MRRQGSKCELRMSSSNLQRSSKFRHSVASLARCDSQRMQRCSDATTFLRDNFGIQVPQPKTIVTLDTERMKGD